MERVVGGWRGREGGWWLALWRRWLVVGVMRLKCGWSKITIAKEKYYLKDHSPVTRIIPSRPRWGNLSEHRLIDITDLGDA